MDLKTEIENFQDYLAPKLDTYEQAIYLYIFRHGRLKGELEVTIGFKSARRRTAFGVGEKGTPMSEGTCYRKLRSLELKGCLKIIGTERGGTKIRLNLPSEIQDLISPDVNNPVLSIEDIDFFVVPENRLAILRRESHKCFYCRRALNTSNYVIEHVVLRPNGNNSYQNLVAACASCNNRKGNGSVHEFLRNLYRDGYLSSGDFEDRLSALQSLKNGKLKSIMDGDELS